MSILGLVIQLAGEFAVQAAINFPTIKEILDEKRNKAERKELKAAKRAEKTARLDEVIKLANAWELAISKVIETKAEGFEAPEWAVSTIKDDPETATVILHECQRQALKAHVVKDSNAEGYDETLANHGIQHLTVTSPRTVMNRLDFLAEVFKARTCNHEYRKTIIRSVVSYSIHKSKVLEKKLSR